MLTLKAILRLPKAARKYIYWDVGSGSADAGLQVKGNYHEANNSMAFQYPARPKTTGGKSSSSQAAGVALLVLRSTMIFFAI